MAADSEEEASYLASQVQERVEKSGAETEGRTDGDSAAATYARRPVPMMLAIRDDERIGELDQFYPRSHATR